MNRNQAIYHGQQMMMKHTANGGDDAWDHTEYLNIWVCNLSGGLLGYTQFPGGSGATDGVVIIYNSLPGSCGVAPYNLGRTATHEIGHWLNLIHVWGDDTKPMEFVNDGFTAECTALIM